jgi:ferredoxin-NAD(P)+ reductase (naphthalene dioxygenase ferredoxin-specific)
VNVVVATGPAGPGRRSGLVTDVICRDLPNLAGWRAYLCGAPAMVEALNLLVARLGIAPGHIHADAFYPSGV